MRVLGSRSSSYVLGRRLRRRRAVNGIWDCNVFSRILGWSSRTRCHAWNLCGERAQQTTCGDIYSRADLGRLDYEGKSNKSRMRVVHLRTAQSRGSFFCVHRSADPCLLGCLLVYLAREAIRKENTRPCSLATRDRRGVMPLPRVSALGIGNANTAHGNLLTAKWPWRLAKVEVPTRDRRGGDKFGEVITLWESFRPMASPISVR